MFCNPHAYISVISLSVSHRQEGKWEPIAKTKLGDIDLTIPTSSQNFNLTSAGVPKGANKVRIYAVITIPHNAAHADEVVEITLFTRRKWKEYKQYLAAQPNKYYVGSCSSENMTFPVWKQDMSLTVQYYGPALTGDAAATVYVTGYSK